METKHQTMHDRTDHQRPMSKSSDTPHIRAVLFDLGDTLINFGRTNLAEAFRLGSQLTYRYLEQQSQYPGPFKKYQRRNLSAIRRHWWLSLITGRDFNAFELLKKTGSKLGIKLNTEQWRELLWLWYEPLRRVATVESDIKTTLEKLKQKNLSLGILSNTFINASALDRHLEQFGLLEYFQTRIYSYRFSFRKPDSRIFKLAAEQIGYPCDNIMFVGDRINKDIKPALKLGMTAVLKKAYTNLGKIPPSQAYCIDSLSELPELIDRINQSRDT